MSMLFIVSNILWLIAAINFYVYHKEMMRIERVEEQIERLEKIAKQKEEK